MFFFSSTAIRDCGNCWGLHKVTCCIIQRARGREEGSIGGTFARLSLKVFRSRYIGTRRPRNEHHYCRAKNCRIKHDCHQVNAFFPSFRLCSYARASRLTRRKCSFRRNDSARKSGFRLKLPIIIGVNLCKWKILFKRARVYYVRARHYRFKVQKLRRLQKLRPSDNRVGMYRLRVYITQLQIEFFFQGHSTN